MRLIECMECGDLLSSVDDIVHCDSTNFKERIEVKIVMIGKSRHDLSGIIFKSVECFAELREACSRVREAANAFKKLSIQSKILLKDSLTPEIKSKAPWHNQFKKKRHF